MDMNYVYEQIAELYEDEDVQDNWIRHPDDLTIEEYGKMLDKISEYCIVRDKNSFVNGYLLGFANGLRTKQTQDI